LDERKQPYAGTGVIMTVYMVEVFFYGEQRTIGIYRTMEGAQNAADGLTLDIAAYADIVEIELQD